AQTHRKAEEIIRRPVYGSQSALLRPVRAVAAEDVSRALIRRVEVVAKCAHHGRVAVERDRDAEAITSRAVSGEELLLLRPVRATAREDVSRALLRRRADIAAQRAHQHGVAAERDRVAEKFAGGRGVIVESLLLRPDPVAARENVGSPDIES